MGQNDIISYLKKRYPNLDVHLIGSGWTSDAFEIGDKIIRVPKTGLEQYEKEVVVLNFLQGKLPVEIPHPKLIKDDDVVYAEHIKIEGFSWSYATYKALSEKKLNLFAKSIAHFFASLHAISVNEIYKKVPEKLLEPYTLDSLNGFKEILKSDLTEKDITTLYDFCQKTLTVKSSPALVHKDFWEANVLVDKKHRLTGVFDWANACVDSREWDFRTLYSSAYMPLFDKITDFYNRETGYKITKTNLDNLRIADALLRVQYFIKNPKQKDTMQNAWQDTLTKVKESLIKVKNMQAK